MTLAGVLLFIGIVWGILHAVDRIGEWQRSPKRIREKLMRQQHEIERKAKAKKGE